MRWTDREGMGGQVPVLLSTKSLSKWWRWWATYALSTAFLPLHCLSFSHRLAALLSLPLTVCRLCICIKLWYCLFVAPCCAERRRRSLCLGCNFRGIWIDNDLPVFVCLRGFVDFRVFLSVLPTLSASIGAVEKNGIKQAFRDNNSDNQLEMWASGVSHWA